MASGEQRKPNTRLRWHRKNRGWSLRKVADLIYALSIADGDGCGITGNLVSRWERGEIIPSPFYREKLCRVYHLTAEELGLLEEDKVLSSSNSQPAAPSQPGHPAHTLVSAPLTEEQQTIIPSIPAFPQDIMGDMGKREKEDMDEKRRKLLRLLGIAGGTLISPLTMPELDWERIEKTFARPSSIDRSVLEDLAAINHRYWRLYLATSSKMSVLSGVIGQLETLVSFLRESPDHTVRQQLCMVASELSQLAGEIYFDMHEYESSQACYVFAAQTAKEAQSYDLWSCALIRHAFLPLFEASLTHQTHSYRDALQLLQVAHRLTEQGDVSLPTRYWAAAVEAEANAGIQNLTSCQKSLDKAQRVSDLKSPSPIWIRFNSTRFPALQGACYVRLRKPDLAMPALQEALHQFPKPDRKRGLAVLDLAAVSIQRREVEQACVSLEEAINIAACGSSTFLRQQIQKFWFQLEPFVTNASVKAIEQQIKRLTISS